MNESTVKHSLIVRTIIFIGFLSISLGVLFYFFYCSYETILQIIDRSSVITFTKGSLYAFGTGLFFLAMTNYMFFTGILVMPDPPALVKKLFKYSIFLMFFLVTLFPFFTIRIVENHVKELNYSRCKEAEYIYNWAIYRTMYYTKTHEECLALAVENSKW